MIELVLLLLPVAAVSGWFAAKRSDKKRGIASSEIGKNPDYFQGLNYLLNEQPDKAIDVFVQMLEVDSETVETHLALGALFRRRGEVERAIRIHQNLIARQTLGRNQRAQALLELGKDYMRAGVFDRAESLFIELTEMNQYSEQALRNLRVIYQQEKDWFKCLEVASKLESLTGEALHTERAHYYCELAKIARSYKDYTRTTSMLRKAQDCDPDCVRATIVQGDMEAEREDWNKAIQAYKSVEQQDPELISEILPSLIECYKKLDSRKELVSYLRQLFGRQKSIATMLALAALIQEDEGDQAATEFIADYLRDHPSLDGLNQLILLSQKNAPVSAADTFSILHQQVGLLLKKRASYLCKQCGLSVKTMHWQCPGCKSWDSIKPLLGLDRDDARG